MTAKQDVLDESPNESPDETDDYGDYNTPTSKQIIQGAFIAANPIKRGKAQDFQWIKLSAINSIESIFSHIGEPTDYCYFNTYKDCKYLTGMNSYDLRKAINTFLFHPDEHWEQFSYD